MCLILSGVVEGAFLLEVVSLRSFASQAEISLRSSVSQGRFHCDRFLKVSALKWEVKRCHAEKNNVNKTLIAFGEIIREAAALGWTD